MSSVIPFSPKVNTLIVQQKVLFATQKIVDLNFSEVLSAFQPGAFQVSAFQTITPQQLANDLRSEHAQLFRAYRMMEQQGFRQLAMKLTDVIALTTRIVGQIKTDVQFIVSLPSIAVRLAYAREVINNGFTAMQNTEIQNDS